MEPGSAPPRRKKFPTLSLLGLIVFLGPGAITFGFALNEASRLGHDWVLISTPLLALASLCLVFGLWRLFGKAGILVGVAIALGSLAAAYVALDKSITQKQEHTRRHKEYRDLDRFCLGKTQADERAMGYNKGQSGIAPTIVFHKRGSSTSRPSQSYDKAFDGWRPPNPYVDDTALVACVTEVRSKPIETCHYSGDRTLDRIVTDVELTLYAIKTGKPVLQTTLPGGMPRPCEGVEKFYGEYKDQRIYGETPSLEKAADQLRPYVEGSATSKEP